MNIYLAIILTILIGEYILTLVVEALNVKSATSVLPSEFAGFYDADKYKKSQAYLKEGTRFDLIQQTLLTIIIIIFILSGGFNFVDNIARSFSGNEIIAGLIFAAILMLCYEIVCIPFSAYHTFIIEEKYGFNRTSVKTFILDLVKTWILGGIIGGLVFVFILVFFLKTGKIAWIYCWISVVLFRFFLIFIAPVLILPLFNKFTPLEDGDLKTKIQAYAKSQDFAIREIFRIDASRRSSKSNAYFTGFGKFRRIALFDTLIQKHTTEELVSVLAHEIGHYKKKHTVVAAVKVSAMMLR